MLSSESSEEVIELVHVNPSEKWNKIYINLGPSITDASVDSPEYFRVYISGSTAEGSDAEYYFDNVKVVYRD